MDFRGKVVIVTGASSGMGRAAAEAFGERGAKVLVNYASSEKGAAETVAAIKAAGGEAVLCRGDVSKEADADRIVATAVKEFGRLDILVNNAGVTRFIPFSDLEAATPEVWNLLYSVNVMGTFLVSRAAAREMRKTGGGVIINNASVSGQRPSGSSMPYCVSKSALLQLTACLSKALGPEIRVNSVSPGFIADTNWHPANPAYAGDRTNAEQAEQSLLKSVGTAKDIANAILFLASDESSFCTGMDIRCDGGRFYTS